MVSKRFQIKITPEDRLDEKARSFKTNQIMEFVYDTSKALLSDPKANVQEVEISYTCPTAKLTVPIPVTEIRPRDHSVMNGAFWNNFWVNVSQHSRVDLIFNGITKKQDTIQTATIQNIPSVVQIAPPVSTQESSSPSLKMMTTSNVDASTSGSVIASTTVSETTPIAAASSLHLNQPSPQLGPSAPRAPPNSPFEVKNILSPVVAKGSPLSKTSNQQDLAQSIQRAFEEGNTKTTSSTNDVDTQSCASSSVVSKASKRERSLPICLESITAIWKVEDESDEVGEEYLLITGRDRRFRTFAYIKQFGVDLGEGELEVVTGEKIMMQGKITQNPEQPNLFTFHTGREEESFDMIARCDYGKFVGAHSTFTKKLVLVPYSFQIDSPIISSSTFYA